MTCGAKGVYLAERETVTFVEAEQVDVADPTGAGDVFFASYIAYRIKGRVKRMAAELATDFTARWLSDSDRNVMLSRRPTRSESEALPRW